MQSGSLEFVVDDGEPVSVLAGEVLLIPKGCWYGLVGEATYLVINCPAFEEGDDDYAE